MNERRDLVGWRGVVHVWFPLVAPIAAWAVHVLFIAGITRYTCNAGGATWSIHAVTAATLAVVVVAAGIAAPAARIRADERADAAPARRRFLGRLALLIAATNASLIVLEELYAIGLHGMRCG